MPTTDRVSRWWPVAVVVSSGLIAWGAGRAESADTRRDVDALAAAVEQLREIVPDVAAMGAMVEAIDRRLVRIEDAIEEIRRGR